VRPPFVTALFVGAALGCVLQSSALMAASSTKAKTHTVVMEGTGFSPDTLTVNKGDRVVWINKDPFPHTATAKGVFDSGSVAPNKRWTYTANKPGDFPYLCTFHPTMKARLIVK
jgi:plastocyanin